VDSELHMDFSDGHGKWRRPPGSRPRGRTARGTGMLRLIPRGASPI